MKTRLLLILLLVSSFAFAQNWSQVGATQFTNFADEAKISFNAAGQPYLLYHNPTNQEVKVEIFNGTNWIDVGATISTQGHNNFAININPVTQEPWVALKRSGSGNASTVDVFRYDGTSWITEGTNILFNSGLYTYGIQLQFNTSGNPRIAGIRGDSSSRKAVFATYNAGSWDILDGRSEPNLRMDFTEYDYYFYSEHYGRFTSFQGYIRKHTVANNSSANEFALGYYPSKTLEVSAISGTNYFVTNDVVPTNNVTNPTPQPDIIFGNGDTGASQPQPLNTLNNTNNILKFRESTADNNYYLMFSDSNENLVFQKYNVNGQIWSVLPSVGLVTSTANFFVSMETNPANGDIYVAYLDGGRVSVKKFEIQTPLPKYYVNANVSGGNGSGDSWTNAMSSLSNALNSSGSVTTDIWVAAGTYKPSTSSRTASFTIGVDNIEVIGGFVGTETSKSQRDILSNPTILSGDLNGDDTGVGFSGNGRTENSYHIVKINGNGIVLDGFKIEDGHANGSSSNAYGSGLLIADDVSSFTLKNSELNNNMGLTGGALRVNFNINATLKIENSIFNNNLSRYGSGMYVLANTNRNVVLDITNTLFTNNSSSNNGGSLGYTGSAAWIRASSANSTVTTTITNCTFAKNTDTGTQSGSQRGTLAFGKRTDGNSTHNATINNSIFYENDGASSVTTTAVNRGHTAMPNLVLVNNSIDEDNFSNLTYLTNTSNSDPLFTDVSNNDFTLQTGSSAINTGDNSKIPAGITTDLLGAQRIHNTTVDMGVYEFGSTVLGEESFELTNSFVVYPNPTSSILNIKMTQDLNKATIYNLRGQLLLVSKNKNIDVSNLSQGIYLLQVEDNNGNRQSKRFIKQ